MKTSNAFRMAFVILVTAVGLAACSDIPTGSLDEVSQVQMRGANSGNSGNNNLSITNIQNPVGVFTPECGNLTGSFTLWAGQHTNAGTVTASYSDGFLTLTFQAGSDWTITETHLEVSSSVPTRRGAPGQYANNGDTNDGITYTVAVTPGQTIYIMAHAVVVNNTSGESETAFAGTYQRNGSWYAVFGFTTYTPQCDDGNPPSDTCFQGQTAWSAGDRFVQQGNWATYTAYNGTQSTVTLFAGQTLQAGTVTFAPENGQVRITITFNSGWSYQNVAENLKIQGYAVAPTGNPSPGNFANKFTDEVSVLVPVASYYGVHLDVHQIVTCPL